MLAPSALLSSVNVLIYIWIDANVCEWNENYDGNSRSSHRIVQKCIFEWGCQRHIGYFYWAGTIRQQTQLKEKTLVGHPNDLWPTHNLGEHSEKAKNKELNFYSWILPRLLLLSCSLPATLPIFSILLLFYRGHGLCIGFILCSSPAFFLLCRLQISKLKLISAAGI